MNRRVCVLSALRLRRAALYSALGLGFVLGCESSATKEPSSDDELAVEKPSSDDELAVEKSADQERAVPSEEQQSNAGAQEEDDPEPLADYAYYDLPVSPEGYRLVEEKDRRRPPQGHSLVPDLPPHEQEKAAQTLKTAEEFAAYLEPIHPRDYCRAAKKASPKDAWGSRFKVLCSVKGRGITLLSAGPDGVEQSEDDVRWGFIILAPKMNDDWVINRDIYD